MEKLVVHGGFTLRGAVNISGSKNASLPILAASLLTDEPVVVRRVPDVSDTNFMVQIMGQLGASVERPAAMCAWKPGTCIPKPLMNRCARCAPPFA